jgi:hypothetical protein
VGARLGRRKDLGAYGKDGQSRPSWGSSCPRSANLNRTQRADAPQGASAIFSVAWALLRITFGPRLGGPRRSRGPETSYGRYGRRDDSSLEGFRLSRR